LGVHVTRMSYLGTSVATVGAGARRVRRDPLLGWFERRGVAVRARNMGSGRPWTLGRRRLTKASRASRVLVAGAAVLAVTGVVAGLNGPEAHQHDAGGHKHVTAGPDVRDLAADPTLSRAGWTAVAD